MVVVEAPLAAQPVVLAAGPGGYLGPCLRPQLDVYLAVGLALLAAPLRQLVPLVKVLAASVEVPLAVVLLVVRLQPVEKACGCHGENTATGDPR